MEKAPEPKLKVLAKNLLALLFSVVLLELLLRLGGWGIAYWQDAGNRIFTTGNKAPVVLMTLGESTTADFQGGEAKAWPRVLEDLFREKGLSVRVVNMAAAGTNSNAIVARLAEQLDTYRPHLVVAMMGINDVPGFQRKALAQKSQLRVVKLFLWFKDIFYEGIRSRPVPKRKPPNPGAERILALLQSGKDTEAEVLLQQLLAEKDKVGRAQELSFLGDALLPPQGAPPIKSERALAFYRRSLDEFIEVDNATNDCVELLADRSLHQECFLRLSRYWQKGYSFSDERLQLSALRCAAQAGGDAEWKQLLEETLPYALQFQSPQLNTVTGQNYRELYGLLKNRGIRLAAMQYPLLPLAALEAYFKKGNKLDGAFADLVFIGNEKPFQEALSRAGYEALFTDRFAGSFGHTTLEGHQILARSAFQALLPLVEKLSLSP